MGGDEQAGGDTESPSASPPNQQAEHEEEQKDDEDHTVDSYELNEEIESNNKKLKDTEPNIAIEGNKESRTLTFGGLQVTIRNKPELSLHIAGADGNGSEQSYETVRELWELFQ